MIKKTKDQANETLNNKKSTKKSINLQNVSISN